MIRSSLSNCLSSSSKDSSGVFAGHGWLSHQDSVLRHYRWPHEVCVWGGPYSLYRRCRWYILQPKMTEQTNIRYYHHATKITLPTRLVIKFWMLYFNLFYISTCIRQLGYFKRKLSNTNSVPSIVHCNLSWKIEFCSLNSIMTKFKHKQEYLTKIKNTDKKIMKKFNFSENQVLLHLLKEKFKMKDKEQNEIYTDWLVGFIAYQPL